MMNPTIKRCVFFLLLCAAAVYATGCGRKEPQDKCVLARINNYEITREDFETAFAKSGIINMGHSGLDPEKMKQSFLENMVINQLLLEEAQKTNMDKDPQFLREIENYWRQTLVKLLLNKKANEMQFVARVTEDEIAREYERYKRKLQVEMVVLKDKIAAQELSGAAADFSAKLSALADKVARQPGPEWWTGGELPYQIENIVFVLKPGEVSKPFATGGQWAVARIIGEEEVIGVKSFKKMHDQIKALLLRNKREQEMTRWLAYLRSQASVQYCVSEFKAIRLNLREPKSGGLNGE